MKKIVIDLDFFEEYFYDIESVYNLSYMIYRFVFDKIVNSLEKRGALEYVEEDTDV